MSGDDFSSILCRIPDEEYAKFKEWLIEQASREQSEHLFTERYVDVGLSLTYLLEVYEAGRSNSIPEAWAPLYKQMKRNKKREYMDYLRLKEKYEGQRCVSEITIEKAFSPPSLPEVNEQPSKKRSKKNKPSGRQFKKDGGVTSFN